MREKVPGRPYFFHFAIKLVREALRCQRLTHLGGRPVGSCSKKSSSEKFLWIISISFVRSP
jgi:hypothetical protein